jgi:YD repeat-containing protein
MEQCMNRYEYDAAGRLRRFWDAVTRLRYTYDESGALVGDPEPFTADENARVDADALESTRQGNAQTIETQVRGALATNRQIVTQLNTVANGTGSLTNTQRDQYIRQLAGYQARAFQQINALARLVVRDLDGTD